MVAHEHRGRLSRALTSTAICLAIASCGSESDSSSGNAGSAGGSDGTVAKNESAPPIDACSLISAEDIAALLGTTVEGKSTSTDPERPECLWENAENYESITLDIGEPGSARNNTLRPPEPGFPEVGTSGPDGMRFLGSGMVQFPAGERDNLVQVAVLSMLGDDANNAAVELARKVTPQISQ
jgi:hypothetical protein